MNNSKLSKKSKCKACDIGIGIMTPARYSKCCQCFLCNDCFLKHICPKNNKTIMTNACSRCLTRSAIFKCQSCHDRKFCRDCDQKIHVGPKFSLHSRLEISSKDEKHKKTNSTQLTQLKEQMNIHQLECSIMEKEIAQKWEQVIKRIDAEFETISLDLKDRKDEILQKLQSKKNQQLQKYFPVDFFEPIKLQEDISINLQSSLRQIRKVAECSSELKGKYQINLKLFEELKKFISKIGVKSIISKKEGEDYGKKNIKNSCILSSLSNLGCSGAKSSKNVESKLSRSTMSWEWKEISDETMELDLSTSKALDEASVSKVKSERTFVNRFMKKPEHEKGSKKRTYIK